VSRLFKQAPTQLKKRSRWLAGFLPRSSHRFDSAMPLGQRFGWARRVSSGQTSRVGPLQKETAQPGEAEAALEPTLSADLAETARTDKSSNPRLFRPS
jgi:hypothetical protein